MTAPMTSKDIQEAKGFDKSTNDWLKEIAYQLALLNEAQAKAQQPRPQHPKR